MSGLVVKTAVVPNSPVVAEPVVANDGWFPDIDPARLRVEHRIRDNITAERLRGAIIGAIVTVGNQLAVWQVASAVTTPSKLADVPAPKIDGTSRNVLLYLRAIGAYLSMSARSVTGMGRPITGIAGQASLLTISRTSRGPTRFLRSCAPATTASVLQRSRPEPTALQSVRSTTCCRVITAPPIFLIQANEPVSSIVGRWSGGVHGPARDGVMARSWCASCSLVMSRQCSLSFCRIGRRRTCSASGCRR